MSAGIEWRDMKHESGPISVKIPTLLTCVTTPSKTSPLKGRNTIALYDGIRDETRPALDETRADVVDCGDGDDEAVFASARALNLVEQLLPNGVQQLDPKISRM